MRHYNGMVTMDYGENFRFLSFKGSLYDFYWKFACERQNIFYARNVLCSEAPWTVNDILNDYKFTNAYRINDRVSQFLISHIIYNQEISKTSYTEEDVIFRILLFKLFNKISTWKKLEARIGNIFLYKNIFKDIFLTLSDMTSEKEKIYSGAYIMPSGVSIYGSHKKYINHLKLLKYMFKDHISDKIVSCRSFKDLFMLLIGYPMIGGFLGYQFATDINYSEVVNFDEMEFVFPGPGAVSGIQKCFPNVPPEYYEKIIRWMTENQDSEFQRIGLNFRKLRGRPLQLIDCQNLFCEFDKYARLAFPQVKSPSGRKRIKTRFHPNPNPIVFKYPPKWHLKNEW